MEENTVVETTEVAPTPVAAPDPVVQEERPGFKTATTSFIFGMLATHLPIPIADVVFGIMAIVWANRAKREGYEGSMQKVAFITAIFGLVKAILFTMFIVMYIAIIGVIIASLGNTMHHW